jgi:hypothetical protein
MSLVTTMYDEVATQHWSAHIKTVECTDVATCIADGGA